MTQKIIWFSTDFLKMEIHLIEQNVCHQIKKNVYFFFSNLTINIHMNRKQNKSN